MKNTYIDDTGVVCEVEHHRPIKKEFVTTWRQEPVKIDTDDMTLGQRSFFDGARNQEMILPDDVRYSDLLCFVGRKTKVTIELLPW